MLRCIALVWLMAVPILCQVNVGQISGTVSDSSAARMPGVAVRILNPATGITSAAVTDEAGLYTFPSLAEGTYTVQVSKEGFGSKKEEGIVLDAASARTADFTLTPGAITETVSVEASAQQVETTTSEVAQTVNPRQVTEIALNGRNYMQLLRIVPGNTTATLDPLSIGLSTTGQNINGVRTPVAITLDGMTNVDSGANISQRTTPNADSISEVKVLTSGYSAEYGGRAAALVNVITKSGTERFHGSLFEFDRNNIFDARSFFATSPEVLHFNDFGGTIGGPVMIPGVFTGLRNKLFFFASEEQKFQHVGSTSLSTVPTTAERSGNFLGSGLTLPVDPSTGAPFLNGQISAARFSHNGPLLLAAYPSPNYTGPGGNYVLTALTETDPREDMGKIDWVASEKTRVSARGSDDYWNQFTGNSATASNAGIVPINFPRPGFVTAINVTHSFSPTLLSYTSLGVGHDAYLQTPVTTNILRSTTGVNFPQLYPGDAYGGVNPNVSIAGFTGYSTQGLDHKYETDIEFHQDVTKIMGAHILKFGAMIVRSRINEYNYATENTNGTVTFNTSAANSTKNALADVLLGNFQTYTENAASGFNYARFWQYEFYAQDTWKVSKRLSLDYGVRYNLHPPNYSILENESTFIPSLYNSASAPQINPKTGALVPGTGNPYNGIALLGSGWPSFAKGRLPQVGNSALNNLFIGLPQGSGKTDYNDWGPRFGFAFDPTGSGQTALRGGFGIFYDTWLLGTLQIPSLNPPFSTSATVVGGNIDNPGVGAGAFPPSLGSFPTGEMKPTEVMSYNLNLQRQLPGQVLIDIGFVGNQGRHLARLYDLNQLPPGTTTNPANKGINANALRPYLGYSSIYQQAYADNSNYNSLQISVSRRTSGGLAFGSAFTWSKALDTTGGGGIFTTAIGPENTYNPRADYGLSSINRQYVVSGNVQYDLPFLKASQNAVLHTVVAGWTLSSLITAQSGAPNSVTIPSDVAGDSVVAGQRASLVPNATLSVTNQTVGNWFNTAAFVPLAQMTPGQFGNSGRNILIGPNYSSLDLSLFKVFRFKERAALQFRGECFNSLNHASFTSLGTTLGTPTFGQVTASAPGRIFQLGLKLLF